MPLFLYCTIVVGFSSLGLGFGIIVIAILFCITATSEKIYESVSTWFICSVNALGFGMCVLQMSSTSPDFYHFRRLWKYSFLVVCFLSPGRSFFSYPSVNHYSSMAYDVIIFRGYSYRIVIGGMYSKCPEKLD